MDSVQTLKELKQIIAKNKIALLYVSQPNCSVCQALLPKIKALNAPTVHKVHADLKKTPEIAGEHFILTSPAVLVFVNGKEMLRKARFISIQKLEKELFKLANLINHGKRSE